MPKAGSSEMISFVKWAELRAADLCRAHDLALLREDVAAATCADHERCSSGPSRPCAFDAHNHHTFTDRNASFALATFSDLACPVDGAISHAGVDLDIASPWIRPEPWTRCHSFARTDARLRAHAGTRLRYFAVMRESPARLRRFEKGSQRNNACALSEQAETRPRARG